MQKDKTPSTDNGIAWVPMLVSELTMDPQTNMPVLLLKDHTGRRAMPIWIGMVEASAIATELENMTLDRPMTHDLMRAALVRLGAQVHSAKICELKDNTFTARLVLLSSAGERLSLECRPSDAIAIAMRMGAPILVSEAVLEAAAEIDLRQAPPCYDLRRDAQPCDEMAAGETPHDYLELLESLDSDAFGKWKM